MRLRTTLGFHLLALALAAAATWWVYRAQPGPSKSGSVPVLDAPPAELSRLEVRRGERHLLAVGDERSGGWWLTVVGPSNPPPRKTPTPDGGQADGAASAVPEPAPAVIETKRYRASSEFDKLLGRLLPLYAERELAFEPERLAAFGLQEPKGTIELQLRGQTVVLLVGGETFGGASTYLRRGPDGPVFLVSSSLLRGLDFHAPQYMERRLTDLEFKALDGVELDCGPLGKQELSRVVGERPEEVRFEPAAGGDPELASNWLEKLLRLSAAEYLTAPPDGLESMSSCQLRLRAGDARQQIELRWSEAQPGKSEAVARSDRTGDWVKLNEAGLSAVLADLPSVLKK